MTGKVGVLKTKERNQIVALEECLSQVIPSAFLCHECFAFKVRTWVHVFLHTIFRCHCHTLAQTSKGPIHSHLFWPSKQAAGLYEGPPGIRLLGPLWGSGAVAWILPSDFDVSGPMVSCACAPPD